MCELDRQAPHHRSWYRFSMARMFGTFAAAIVFLAILRAMGGTIVQLLAGSGVALLCLGMLGQFARCYTPLDRRSNSAWLVGWHLVGSHVSFCFGAGFIASMATAFFFPQLQRPASPPDRWQAWELFVRQLVPTILLMPLSFSAACFFVRRCRACQFVVILNVVFFWSAVWLITR